MNKIKGLINNLNSSWFEKIKKEFENSDLYDKELNKIFNEEVGFDEDGNEIIITIDNSIENYCWNNYIHTSGYVRYLAEQNELCLCGFDICRYIFEYIDGCLLETNTIEEKYKLLAAYYKKIATLFSKFIDPIKEESYRSAIVYIKENCLKEFFVKYQHIKDLNNLIKENAENSKIDNDIKVVNNQNSVNSKFKLKNLDNNVYDRIQDLLISLKNFNLIDQSTSKTQLNRLFTGKIPEEKILWTGHVDTFKYFIKLLEDEEKINKLGKKKTITLNDCFILSKNRDYDFKMLKNIRKISNKKLQDINKIINQI